MKIYDCWVTVHVGQIEADSELAAEEWALDAFDEAIKVGKALDIETFDVKEVEP